MQNQYPFPACAVCRTENPLYFRAVPYKRKQAYLNSTLVNSKYTAGYAAIISYPIVASFNIKFGVAVETSVPFYAELYWQYFLFTEKL